MREEVLLFPVGDGDPARPSADILDLAAARAARDPRPTPAPNLGAPLADALRVATAGLLAQMAALERRTHALTTSLGELTALRGRLGAESRRSRAIAAQAERIAAAIDAGDLVALERLQRELTQLAEGLPSICASQRPDAGVSSARNCAP
jgi:hypothetical protein